MNYLSIESYIITVQFRRNNGSFGGKDYAYKVSSPLYRPNEKTQILIQNMVNEKGYVYIAESPLFEITTSDKTYFAYDENEKTKILKMIGNKKFDIQRSKGLGENEAEMMSLTTMDPATRRLIKIEPDDIEQTQWMFDMLLGDDLQGRKDFITNNGVDYLDMADIS